MRWIVLLGLVLIGVNLFLFVWCYFLGLLGEIICFFVLSRLFLWLCLNMLWKF